MSELIAFDTYPVKPVLNLLLADKTTKKNIIFATDGYADCGEDFSEKSEMTVEKITGAYGCRIMPRVEKNIEAQRNRTRIKAEVMTPGFIINKMNNYADREWFGRENVFNTENERSWIPTEDSIEFPDEKRSWKKYVDTRRIEITCGEAPYIVTRYDVTTGELIPLKARVGLLDRKLRVVNENCETEESWLKWAERAIQSVYGYEWQGDNLLIGRINVLCTYTEYLQDHWNRQAAPKELRRIANIIAWNFWQMDGLTGTIPYGEIDESCKTFSAGDEWSSIFGDEIAPKANATPPCKIWDWRLENALPYNSLKGGTK